MRRVKAVSPVIATIILVAVTIALTLAAVVWMASTAYAFMKIENLQVREAYTTRTERGWEIALEARNAGTRDITVDEIFINGKPYTMTPGVTVSPKPPIPLPTGSRATVTVKISGSFNSGDIIEIKLRSASGNTYPYVIILP